MSDLDNLFTMNLKVYTRIIFNLQAAICLIIDELDETIGSVVPSSNWMYIASGISFFVSSIVFILKYTVVGLPEDLIGGWPDDLNAQVLPKIYSLSGFKRTFDWNQRDS